MIPYRIKHKATGLYYKPGSPNLSKTGKLYGTGNNRLNYLNRRDYLEIISTKRSVTKQLEDLGYKSKWFLSSSRACFEIPKSEFELEYFR